MPQGASNWPSDSAERQAKRRGEAIEMSMPCTPHCSDKASSTGLVHVSAGCDALMLCHATDLAGSGHGVWLRAALPHIGGVTIEV